MENCQHAMTTLEQIFQARTGLGVPSPSSKSSSTPTPPSSGPSATIFPPDMATRTIPPCGCCSPLPIPPTPTPTPTPPLATSGVDWNLFLPSTVSNDTTDAAPTSNGPTGCYPDLSLFFHLPELDKDSGPCIYTPTFTDVPLTISMVAYFIRSFFHFVPFAELRQKINREVRKITNEFIYGTILFTYVPVVLTAAVIIWALVLSRNISWALGFFLTVLIVVIFWISYLLFDRYARVRTGQIFTQIENVVVDSFEAKSGDIICRLLRGYLTGLTHMMVPEASVCTSTMLPEMCFDSGITGPEGTDLFLPSPSWITNTLISCATPLGASGPTGFNLRCDGVDNTISLLPVAQSLCPCFQNLSGFTFTSEQIASVAQCILPILGPQVSTNPCLATLFLEGFLACNPNFPPPAGT